MTSLAVQLNTLSSLGELFRLFNSGKHLNRLAEPILWAALEQESENYQQLFTALGYELKIDVRGYAWFHNEELNSHISKTSRRLALFFMTIFDSQADAGKPLLRFCDWRLDKPFLTEMYRQHKEVLEAEGLDLDNYLALLESAARIGFTQEQGGYWRLLPAVYRYLDYFEQLAAHHKQADCNSIECETLQGQILTEDIIHEAGYEA